MKIVILGDLHFGARNANDAIIFHQKKFFNFFFNYLEEHGIKMVLQLGDCFDNRRQTNSKALSFAYTEFFDKLRDHGIKMYSILGNHDIYFRESIDIHTGGILLRQFENIEILDHPCKLELDGCTFDFIPWICDENKKECLEYITNSDAEYCLGHFEINDFEVMPNVQFTGGLEESVFKKYKKVFSGHFHLKSDRHRVYYVGTPFQLNWADANRTKSFVVFDTETKTYEDVVNEDNFHLYLEYDDINKKFSKVDGLNPHSFIKLLVKNKEQPFLFNEFTKRIYKSEPADVKFIESKFSNLNEQEEVKLSVQTMEDIIANYIKNSSFDNKDDLTRYMLTLYNQAIMGEANNL